MEEGFNLGKVTNIIKKRYKLLVIIPSLLTLISAVFSYFVVTPVYSASTQLLVSQSGEENTFNMNELQTNLQLINTYNVIIKSPRILDIVIERLQLNMRSSDLNGRIRVENAQNSQVVTVTAQDSNPARAIDIANTTASAFQSEIVKIMKVDNVSILSEADLSNKVKPRPTLNIFIAFLSGVLISVALIFILEILDNTIKDERELESIFGAPVLGGVALMGQDQLKTQKRSRDK